MLAEVYRPWFDALLDAVPPQGRALEIGAGPGFFRERAAVLRPDIRLTSLDVLTTPWNDLVGDALRLPLRSSTFDAIVGTDVLHHLARPAAFFAEGGRVLRPGGVLAFIEPWVSPFSYPIYRFLHQEGCTLGLDPWRPFGDALDKPAFDGDAAVVPGLVRQTPAERWRELGLGPPAGPAAERLRLPAEPRLQARFAPARRSRPLCHGRGSPARRGGTLAGPAGVRGVDEGVSREVEAPIPAQEASTETRTGPDGRCTSLVKPSWSRRAALERLSSGGTW